MPRSILSLLLLSSALISVPVAGSNEAGQADLDWKSVRAFNPFDSLPDELVLMVLEKLDPKSAATAERTCRRLRRVINDQANRKFFLSPEDLASLEEIVGQGRVQKVFAVGGYHKLALLLKRIMAQPACIIAGIKNDFKKLGRSGIKNDIKKLELSDQNKLAVAANAGRLFRADMDGNDLAAIIAKCAKLEPEQITAISANSERLFTADMEGGDRAKIIASCDKLKTEQIAARAQAISENSDRLFQEAMNGYNRGIIIAALTKIEPEQITARAQAISTNSERLFKKGMRGYNRDIIIAALAQLEPEQMAALHFDADQSVRSRLVYIRSIVNARELAFPG